MRNVMGYDAAMSSPKLVFSGHALGRMFQRAIRPDEVRAVVESGEAIEHYPDDVPFPSQLLLGWVEGRPLHVVVAVDAVTGTAHIVTAYVPDPSLWEPDCRRRRPK
jgi:hypothetical protein